MNSNFNIEENNFFQETFENNILTETEVSTKNEEYKRKYLSADTLRFFRNLGGFEKTEQSRKFNLGCTMHTSISPDGQTKKITYFFY